jgi:hypothetical protein
MNANEAMERIEGHAFSAMVNLASDFSTFLRILTSQPEVRALADEMKSERVTRDVFARVGELAAKPVDDEYEHSADSALAAYLWLLSTANGDCSASAADTVLECKQCWWARKMAEYIRGQKEPEKYQETLQAQKGS